MREVTGKTKTIFISLIFVIAIISKIFQYGYLPYKYFVDSNKILAMIVNPSIVRGLSYNVTALFFRTLNIILNLSSLKEWSYILTLFFNIIFFIILNKNERYSLLELTYIYLSMAILDIFSFNLSKEIIQITIFLIIYRTVISKNKENKKIIIIDIVLLLESLLFRNYYVLMLLGFNITYFISIYFQNLKSVKKIIFSILIFLIILSFSRFIFPSMYNQLINIREILEDSLMGANTLIINRFRGENFLYYIGNYIVNFIRIIFPVELINKGALFILFFIYQIFQTIIILYGAKSKDYILFSLILGYFICSVTFEPDFGSIIRHESTMFPIMLLMAKKINIFNSMRGKYEIIVDNHSCI